MYAQYGISGPSIEIMSGASPPAKAFVSVSLRGTSSLLMNSIARCGPSDERLYLEQKSCQNEASISLLGHTIMRMDSLSVRSRTNVPFPCFLVT